jgi:uncharacterized membrane protein YheB (UPF0754 family)
MSKFMNMPRAHISPGKRNLLPLPPDLRREELLRGYLCLSALEAGIGEQGHLGTLARMWMVSYYLYREKVKIESLAGLAEARETLLRISKTGLFSLDGYATKRILTAMLLNYEAQLEVAPLHKVAQAVGAAEAETATAMSGSGGVEKMFAT